MLKTGVSSLLDNLEDGAGPSSSGTQSTEMWPPFSSYKDSHQAEFSHSAGVQGSHSASVENDYALLSSRNLSQGDTRFSIWPSSLIGTGCPEYIKAT